MISTTDGHRFHRKESERRAETQGQKNGGKKILTRRLSLTGPRKVLMLQKLTKVTKKGKKSPPEISRREEPLLPSFPSVKSSGDFSRICCVFASLRLCVKDVTGQSRRAIGVGMARRPPLPPNRTGGFPASGFPVSGLE